MRIDKASFVKGSVKLSQLPPADKPEIAFVGRSNVGKSSLINALTNRKGLARTSSTPGKTREINHFLINDHWLLADLPGYGYAKVGKKQRAEFLEMILEYSVQRENLMNIFVLIDCRIPPQDIDLEFCEFLKEDQVPYAVVFTKTDKPNQKTLNANLKAIKAAFVARRIPIPPMIYTSAVKGRGISDLLAHIDDLLTSYA
ncbi:MAG: ribosome biogenesis GTP-binding protein YihA/YsxC [Bacteroidia bacterium]